MSSPPPTSPTPMVWPPSTVMPFPLPWGGTGCCPPGGMDALMKCYCDIQAASAFIGQIMIDQINNNPAVVEAIIAALEKSGSTLPLIGVTDGSNAQPGQVGEFIEFEQATPIIVGSNTFNLSMGVLPAGDWDATAFWSPFATLDSASFLLNPTLPSASNFMAGQLTAGGGIEALTLIGQPARISMSVPTLIVFQLQCNSTTTGNGIFEFSARRAR